MGIELSKPSQISPTPQKRETDDDEAFDRTLIIKIDDDDPTLHSPEDQQNNSSKVTRIITFDVCSTKLANKSLFFNKMFSIGMKESGVKAVTLKIGGYEEAAFRDMMNYIESNKLPSKNHMELLELLMISDKFEVPSCTKSCVDSLIPAMDHELALLVWNIPIAKIGDIRRLIEEAEMFFNGLTNFHGFPDDLGGFNQGIISHLLSRNSLRLDSEDEAYDFLMKWVMSHFLDPEERRKFLQSHVTKLIRFPYLSNSKRSAFYGCPYMENKFKNAIKLELESYENEKRNTKKMPLPKKLLYTKRIYKYLPVKVFEPESNENRRYLVFLEMDRRDFKNLAEAKSHRTVAFRFEEQDFHLACDCQYHNGKPSSFGMRFEGEGKLQNLMRVRLEVWYLKNFAGQFVLKARKVTVLNRRKSSIGCDHLLGVEWDKLLAADSSFFVNGRLLLRIAIHVS